MTKLKKKLIERLFYLDRWKKRLIQITFDFFTVSIAFLLAFLMRLETIDYIYLVDTYIGIFIVMIATLAIFMFRGLYNNLTRYISIETAYTIAIGSYLSCAILIFFIFLLDLEIPVSVSLIYATLLCGFATAVRLLVRYLGQNMIKENREHVAIYGAGSESIQLMDALRKNPNYHVMLLIDDTPELDGKNIGGIPVRSLDYAKIKFQSLRIETLL